jgi:hypothetical protein
MAIFPAEGRLDFGKIRQQKVVSPTARGLQHGRRVGEQASEEFGLLLWLAVSIQKGAGGADPDLNFKHPDPQESE